MMVVGGEINTGIPGIADIFETKDEGSLLNLAGKQISLGSDMLGINLGSRAKEEEEMAWAVSVIQSHYQIPIAFDTSNLRLLRSVLKGYDKSSGRALLNSTTAKPEHLAEACQLALEYDLLMVALPTDGVGKEESDESRLKHTTTIVEKLSMEGIPINRLYLDPMLYPLSVREKSGPAFLHLLRAIRKEFPEANTICGLDNISHGLPGRELISAFFLAMAMEAGLSAVIMKTNPLHWGALKASEALLAEDPSCLAYIEAWRTGVWDLYLDDDAQAGTS